MPNGRNQPLKLSIELIRAFMRISMGEYEYGRIDIYNQLYCKFYKLIYPTLCGVRRPRSYYLEVFDTRHWSQSSIYVNHFSVTSECKSFLLVSYTCYFDLCWFVFALTLSERPCNLWCRLLIIFRNIHSLSYLIEIYIDNVSTDFKPDVYKKLHWH